MSRQRTHAPHEPGLGVSPTEPTLERLRLRLEAYTQEALVGLLERLAGGSDELVARLRKKRRRSPRNSSASIR